MKRKNAKNAEKKKDGVGKMKINKLREMKKNKLRGTAQPRHSPPETNYPGDTPSWP